nr:ribonuclease H-like domain-containing protein [Tanacetum cinerariifolium]
MELVLEHSQQGSSHEVSVSTKGVKELKRIGNPQIDLQDKGVIDSGCSRHMTGNMSYLTNYEEFNGGYVAFGGNPKGGKITSKASKDETSTILKTFITGIENLVDPKVKVIRCDNRTEFKNRETNQFCEMKESKNYQDDGFQPLSDVRKKVDEDPRQERKCKVQEKEDNVNITNNVNVVGTNGVNAVGVNTNNELPFDPEMPTLEDISTFNFSSDHEDDDGEADMNNMDSTIQATVKAKTVNGEGQLQALVDGKKVIITESTIRRDFQLEDTEGVDCLPNVVIFKQLTLMETTKTNQAMEFEILKSEVKKLERRKRSRTYRLKRLYMVGLSARVESSKDENLGEEDASKQGRIADIDSNEDITLVSTHDEQMFDAGQDLVTTAVTTPIILIDEVTLAQALAELKHTKPKANVKGIVFHEPEESTTTANVEIPKLKSQDKGKAKMIEEHVKLKKKDQIQLDEEVALKLQAELQAEFEKVQRLTGDRAQ